MGYTTDFSGEFKVNKKVDEETYNLLVGLTETRRMARKVAKKYGVEGEFYVEDRRNMGQNDCTNIIDYNTPPKTQPGLWCQWRIQEDRKTIQWDGGEKFYNYVEWIKYLIKSVLQPRGYVLNGEVQWQGEDSEDGGIISIENNKVEIKESITFYVPKEDVTRIKELVDYYLSNPMKELIDHKIDRRK